MRICNECGKHIKESGYVVENGVEYYCSNDCLHKHYTPSEWEKCMTMVPGIVIGQRGIVNNTTFV